MERRLAAILAADVVGYSRLMGEDETGTLDRLNALLKELIQPKLTERKGRIVKLMGDGLLAEFPSVVEAVQCAVAIQEAMAGREADLPDDQRIRLRIGVNLGDIIGKGSDIYGDGVNVAARLEALADPGTVCVSGTVYDHVAGKIGVAFADMGEQNVKNIDKPIHAYRIAPAGTAPPEIPASGSPAADIELEPPDRPSIAVLPFTNMGSDEEQEYFADGMVEDIITGLSRIKWLFVIARNSSFVYKGRAVDVKEVGRELGVRYVLEGSVRKASGRVRVTGQLIEAETDRHVWADRYDRTLDDVFAIQDELTMSVVAAIEPSLRQAEVERVKRKRPDSLDAYDLLLRALPEVYTAMPDGARNALVFLDNALEMEPDYALAHGFAAWAREILFARGGRQDEDRLASIRHAHEALAHGRDDALALSLGGFAIGMMDHDRTAAMRAFEASLDLSPSCALAYILGSVVSVFAGDAERGIEWGDQAMRLSPFDPIGYAALFSVSVGHFYQGAFEASADAAYKAFQANPFWSSAHFMLAATHAKLGRPDQAAQSASRVLELEPGFTASGMCTAFDVHPSIADPLTEALLAAGLPP